jgi:hypothetical protein
VNWLSRLEAQGARVVLVGCSVHIVDQINMVHNFVGSGQVKSFHAPYYCAACDLELQHYLEVAEIGDPLGTHPPCPRCGRSTELDHLPEQFFAFLEDRKRILTDPEVCRQVARMGKGFSIKIRELDGAPRQAQRVDLPAPAAPPHAALPALPPPPPSSRRAGPLRDITGPHALGAVSGTEPPETPSRPQGRSLMDTAPAAPSIDDDEEIGTARVPFVPVREPPPEPPADRFSPVATALLVAGIVVVIALMLLIVLRSG